MTFLDSLRNYLRPQILGIMCLGFVSGVPYGILMDPLNYWLSEEGIQKSTIGLLSLVFLIYSLKVFWAPLVDRVQIPFLSKKIGHRRGWIVLMQIAILICLFFLEYN